MTYVGFWRTKTKQARSNVLAPLVQFSSLRSPSKTPPPTPHPPNHRLGVP